MENGKNEFSGLINMIKIAINEERSLGIEVKHKAHGFVYNEVTDDFIEKTFKLNISDEDNICQNLHDCLINEFGEQISPGYSHDFLGRYTYFMTLGDNIIIFFPPGLEYHEWIYNQVQKDNQKIRKKCK